MNSKWKVSPVMFGATILSFLLPFITVSCGGQRVASFTGLQLAAGTTVEQPQMFGPPQKQRINPEPTATVAIACAIVGLIAGLARSFRTAIVSSIAGGIGAISLLIMKSHLDDAIAQQGHGMLQANYESGFSLALLLLISSAAWNGYLSSQSSQFIHSGVTVGAGPPTLAPVVGNEAAKRAVCANCGAQLSADAKFCDECGRPAKNGTASAGA